MTDRSPVRPPDRAVLLRATAANHRAWFRRCAATRNGAVEDVGGIALVAEPPWGTLPFPGARARSPARLDAIMARVRELELTRVSCWSLGEDRVLGTLLIARGFEWGWEPHWMALDLERIPDEEDARHEVVIVGRNGVGPRELPYWTPRADPARVTHLAVRDHTEIVGHVVVNPWRGFAGIYNMGVADARRRQGIGRALTIAACRAGREAGCTHAVLNATPEGELLYRTVGFESLGMGQTWWRHPGRWPTPRQTALVEAIGLGGVNAVEALHPTRAELERPIPGPGPPLVVTANTRAAAVADWILSRCPELVDRRLDGRGAALLHFAVEGNDEALLRVALEHGADTSLRDSAFGGTPLGWAQHLGRARLAALLS